MLIDEHNFFKQSSQYQSISDRTGTAYLAETCSKVKKSYILNILNKKKCCWGKKNSNKFSLKISPPKKIDKFTIKKKILPPKKNSQIRIKKNISL